MNFMIRFVLSFFVSIFLILNQPQATQNPDSLAESISTETETSETHFKNKWYDINVLYDAFVWSKSESVLSQNQLLLLQHQTQDAKLSIFAYTYAEESTLEEFVSRRVAQSYDGWKSLGQRKASAEELGALNLAEGFLSLYANQNNEEALLKDYLIIEYYFKISAKKYFVISLQAHKNAIQELKQTFKTLVLNTWVGERQEKTKLSLDFYPDEWHLRGKGMGNTRAISRKYDGLLKAQLQWQKSFPALEEPIVAIRSTKNNIFVFTESTLYNHSLTHGAIKWKRKFRKISDSITYDEKYLYLIVEQGAFSRNSRVARVNMITGKTKFILDLKDPLVDELIILEDKIYVLQPTVLKVFNKNNLNLVESYTLKGRPAQYLLMNTDHLVIVQEDKMQMINRQSGTMIFQQPLENLLYQKPILKDDKLYVCTSAANNNRIKFQAFDLSRQKFIWQQILFLDDSEKWLDLSLANTQLVLLTQNADGILKANIFDVSTGGLSAYSFIEYQGLTQNSLPLRLEDRYLLADIASGLDLYSLKLNNDGLSQKLPVKKAVKTGDLKALRPTKQGYVIVSMEEKLHIMHLKLLKK